MASANDTPIQAASPASPTASQPLSGTARCTECGGSIVTQSRESYCEACGLVLSKQRIDDGPTRALHGPSEGSGPKEWGCEAVQPLRIDKGLHTTFFLGKDGNGNPLSSEQKDKYGRLRRKNKRFRVESDRAIRLNEALRDVQMIGGNLTLPGYVVKEAGSLARAAGKARVPGAWTTWEGVAGGAILLAATDAGIDLSPREVSCYTKESHDRVCAAARKIRCYTDTDHGPIRRDAVAQALETFDEATIDDGTYPRLKSIAQHLLELADETPIGAGTPRLTVAAAAVYRADRLIGGEHFTMKQVADSVSTIVDTSKDKISRYSAELRDAYADRSTHNLAVLAC